MPNLEKQQTNLSILIDLWVYLYLAGLVFSKALLSIAMIGFAGTALYHWYTTKDREIKELTPFLFPVIIFLITLLTGNNSEDKSVLFDFIMKKLPFLILPFAFFSVRSHLAKRYHHYLTAFVFVVTIISLGVLGNYLMNFELLNDAISKGKAITTPIDHTEFSIYIGFAAISSMFLCLENRSSVRYGTKTTLLYITIFLIIFLHVLAVRSGLAVFYATVLVVGSYYLIKNRRFKMLMGFLVLVIILPLLAVNTVPSLKKKVGYFYWDIGKYKKGEGVNLSDSQRLYSLRAGWEIFQENPYLGVGVGDLKAECKKKYVEYLGEPLDHYPHNQYLFVLASMGILGFLFYLWFLLGPLVYFRKKYDPYFMTLYGVILVSALVENTLERTFSIGFYLFFVLLCISYMTRPWAQQK